jgi:hypothetical protein
MIKLIGRRASLLLLASVLLGAIFGSFNNSATLAQHVPGPEEPILFEGSGGGGGGGGGHYCSVSSVVVNGKTCTASGCRLYSNNYPVFVCDYRGSNGSSSDCPPLEQCS